MFDLGRTLFAAKSRHRHALALVDDDTRLTYEQLFDAASRLVFGLDRLGIGHGDRLLVITQNRAETAITHWAAQLAGVITTPINWRAKAGDLDFFLMSSGARAIVFDPASEESVRNSRLAQELPRIGVAAAYGETIRFTDLLNLPAPCDLPRSSTMDTSILLYTSGTTGQSKGVPRRHYAERAAAIAHIAQNAYLSGEIMLGVMPLYHTMGVRSLLAMALINGAFICQRRFDAGEALRLIAAERISALYLVPTLYHDILAHPDFLSTDISSVRKIGFAGAPMTDGLLQRLHAAFRPDLLVNHYGSTEVYTITIEQNAARKPGSAGKAGINTDIRLVKLGSTDPDDTAPPGEEGQVIATIAGDEAFEGYWQRPDADAKALHGGWYFTGDIGHVDKEGDLFVTGRVDDMMIAGGENVLPAEIESVLSLHPAVAEIAVAGVPDERWGHRITAFVRRVGSVTAEELDAWCRQSHLASFKRPRAYVFVEAIPKSPVGKILRHMLVQGNCQREV